MSNGGERAKRESAKERKCERVNSQPCSHYIKSSFFIYICENIFPNGATIKNNTSVTLETIEKSIQNGIIVNIDDPWPLSNQFILNSKLIVK